MIFKWPATLPSGRTIDAMVSSLDLFSTFVSAAGGRTEKSDKLTGVDLLPFLTGKREQPPHESLMWTYTVGSAIRTGDWKLIRLPDRWKASIPRPESCNAKPTAFETPSSSNSRSTPCTKPAANGYSEPS